MIFSVTRYFELLKMYKFEEAIDYCASFVPDYIFKFFWLFDNGEADLNQCLMEQNELRFTTLARNELWFALPQVQNDPFEFRGMYYDREKVLEAGFTEEMLARCYEIMHNIPFCCFVGNCGDNMPMWAHYANNHKGYCVKYRVMNKKAVRKIMYESTRMPITNIFISFFANAERYFAGMTNKDEALFCSTILRENYFIKHKSWESEEEYRIIYPQERLNSTGMNVDIGNVGLKVEEIICGFNCSTKNTARLAEIAKALGVPCKKCELSNTEFAVYRDV